MRVCVCVLLVFCHVSEDSLSLYSVIGKLLLEGNHMSVSVTSREQPFLLIDELTVFIHLLKDTNRGPDMAFLRGLSIF